MKRRITRVTYKEQQAEDLHLKNKRTVCNPYKDKKLDKKEWAKGSD
jgi:hypothetical protein